MGAGKALSIISGIIVLIGTFALAWWEFFGGTVSGLSVVNISNMFDLAEVAGDDAWKVYLSIGLFFGVLISGVMILLGAKARALSVIFGLIVLAKGTLMLLAAFTDITFVDQLSFLDIGLLTEPIVEGVFPYFLEITTDLVLGQVVLTFGGLLAIISGFMKRED